MNTVLITGSNGLIGSECVKTFSKISDKVIGIDNDMRSYFFGNESSTKDVGSSLQTNYTNYEYHNLDIRYQHPIEKIFIENDIDLIVHAAAQPSHDWAAKEPLTDFSINAISTIQLLELYRQYCPKASFIFTSTNKVYGDTPNKLPLIEKETRYDYDIDIDENMSIDNSKHSIFGASKVAADIMVQEYGKYFGLNTVCFRCGCLTGSSHRGAKLHGFLSYLVKCILNDEPYSIYGYKGKQVRDNLHSHDLVNAFLSYHESPKPGSVYNIGGGRDNAVSILEAISMINEITNKQWNKFTIEQTPRAGDHQWYISDLRKFKTDYQWEIKISLPQIIEEMSKR